jgi:uncharacterized protein (DUF2249 family)
MPATAPDTLDVRPVAPQRTHPTVIATYDKLALGESFVLVDDQDPAYVREALEARPSETVRWEYLKAGPDVWHVRITRMSAE